VQFVDSEFTLKKNKKPQTQ